MTPQYSSLMERREEFDTHFALARALEDRSLEGSNFTIGDTTLSIRHIMTMKSGLIVHLYNIVEATMTGMMEVVGLAIVSIPPGQWSENALREWLRKHAAASSEGSEDGRLRIVHDASRHLLGTVPRESRTLKKPSGTWSDKLIYTFAKRLGVEVRLPPEMHRRMAKRQNLRDMTVPEFVADTRNAIAHGRRTFEDGARDLTLADIRDIADVTLDFLTHVVNSFDGYVAAQSYRAVAP